MSGPIAPPQNRDMTTRRMQPRGQTNKPLGADRVPMSNERMRPSDNAMRSKASVKLGVPLSQLTQKPGLPVAPIPKAPVQGPAVSQLPPTGQVPLPRPRPLVPPTGQVPLPRPRPLGANAGDPFVQQANKMAQLQPAVPLAPTSAPGGDHTAELMALLKQGQADPVITAENAQNAPPPVAPKPYPWSASAQASPVPPVMAPGATTPQDLAKVVAAVSQAKDAQRPTTDTTPAPTNAPKLAPGISGGPPQPNVVIKPAQETFAGYEKRVEPDKKNKVKETKPLKKGDSLYYDATLGLDSSDKTMAARALTALRKRAQEDPASITPQEDKLLASTMVDSGGANLSMEPNAVKARFAEYQKGNGKGNTLPPKFDARPQGAPAANTGIRNLPEGQAQALAAKVASDAIAGKTPPPLVQAPKKVDPTIEEEPADDEGPPED